ncbi:hypothetical protein QTJ16_004040 [Diplocarpon rosae]|uniref:Uncharacterized protein n=1 Tax=Diplocarpon rosae TaxID=946125 RepID=A0AAD9WD06_9HELO|nr:hypothetical protein QTJ16_004040 [Diplocarpon rosae]PBP17241.1 hypothetical protein BUE80_DR011934 [Diplocarpon rosae]
MNRFRTKKKGKEGPDELTRASTDSDGPPPAIKPSKTFRLGKKSQPEPKPEIDLSTALPTSDNFRTSLLMSGLSARFSMLREQDDPTSKIGKASDDSVLSPKRLSRFNDFGHPTQGLSDIAEVSSISGSVRPPFAFSRTESYAGSEGYGTDDDSMHGSMMNRSKPGEGNNLFGGRQKIMMGNRALYESDVSQSAFQKIREREREELREQEREREELEAQSSRPSSPQLSGYNKNRETSSTTSSGGPITGGSTPATSFTSPRTPSLSGGHTPVTPSVSGNGALQRSTTKTRRLYETGLDNHLCEQQFSAMNRIDTLTRQRTLDAQTPPPGFSPTFGSIPADRWDRQIAGKQSMPNLRAVSPPHSGSQMESFESGVRNNSKPHREPYGITSPPLSPPMTEHDEYRAFPIQPNGKGKDTVMNGLPKPTLYEDGKYSQRQAHTLQGREAAPPSRQLPSRVLAPRYQQQQLGSRTRAESNTTHAPVRTRSNSSTQKTFPSQERMPEAPMNKVLVPDRVLAPLKIPSGPCDGRFSEQSSLKNHVVPLELTQPFNQDQRANLECPEQAQHPATRPRMELSPAPSPALLSSNLQSVNPIVPKFPTDSPTLGPGTGLSGLVRSHLRIDSNVSSVCGGPPPTFASRLPARSNDAGLQHEYNATNNQMHDDDWDQESSFANGNSTNFMNGTTPRPLPFSVRSPNTDASGKALWEKEMESRHTRNESSETQKERQEFQNELASRRRKVQEKMQSLVENDTQSASPLPRHPADWTKDAYQVKSNALGLLKNKTSRGSLANRPKEAGSSKAKRMPGIGNGSVASGVQCPAKPQVEEIPWNRQEEEWARGQDNRAFIEAQRPTQRDMERTVGFRNQQRLGPDNDQDWPVQRMERDRSRMINQRMDNYWADNSRLHNPRTENLRINNRMENHHDHRLEISRMNNQYRNRDQGDRIPIHTKPPHRTPSRERKPPPVAYAHRNGGNGQESRNSSGTSNSGSRPPSNAPSNSSRDRSESDASGGRSKSRTGTYRDDLAKAMVEGLSINTQVGYEERELLPPSRNIIQQLPGANVTGLPASPSPILSPMMGSNRSRSSSKSTPAGYPEKFPPMEGADAFAPPRPSPSAPYKVNATPALVQPSSAGSGTGAPPMQGPQPPIGASVRKKSINKSEISEPMFISSTSSMSTVNLLPGPNLQSGPEINAPPIPPVNPKRRQTRTMFGGLMGRKDDDEIHRMPSATHSTEEISTFSADEGDPKPRTRQKLRKSSSEGGHLNARARQAANAAPSPAMPGTFLPVSRPPPCLIEGGMF